MYPGTLKKKKVKIYVLEYLRNYSDALIILNFKFFQVPEYVKKTYSEYAFWNTRQIIPILR